MCSGTIRCGCAGSTRLRPVGDTVAIPVAAAILAALSVLPVGLRRPVRRALHRHRSAGRADRLLAQTRRSASWSHAPRMHRLREPARAAARHAVHRLAARRLRRTHPQRLAGCRSAPHGAARSSAPAGIRARFRAARPARARIVRYANTEIVVEVTAPLDEILVLNDIWHPWWRATVDGTDTAIIGQRDLPRRAWCRVAGTSCASPSSRSPAPSPSCSASDTASQVGTRSRSGLNRVTASPAGERMPQRGRPCSARAARGSARERMRRESLNLAGARCSVRRRAGWRGMTARRLRTR